MADISAGLCDDARLVHLHEPDRVNRLTIGHSSARTSSGQEGEAQPETKPAVVARDVFGCGPVQLRWTGPLSLDREQLAGSGKASRSISPMYLRAGELVEAARTISSWRRTASTPHRPRARC